MNIKRLVLGTAAGALAVTGAQAADLPVVVEPVDYVQICSAYGNGYFFVPGTEGCLRIRGRVRTDFQARFDLDNNGVVLPGRGADDFGDTLYNWRARAEMSFDHITETEFGQLRAFANLRFDYDSGVGIDATPPGTAVNLPTAFIQLGGLLVGRTTSNFRSPNYGPEVILDVTGDNPDILQIAYTAQFGNGFSATLALEDTTERRAGIGSTDSPVFALDGNYGGAKVPDLVASLGVSQGWGSANVSGLLRWIEAAQVGVNTNTGAVTPLFNRDTAVAWAIAGNVSVNIPFGTATSFGIGAGYSEGATETMTGGFSPGFMVTDAIFTNNTPVGNGSLELTKAWAVGGQLTSAFTPTVAGTLAAGYVNISTDGVVPEASNWNVQGQIAYTPVTDFTISAGVEYRYADIDWSPFNVQPDSGSGLGTYIRLQRDF